jgi:membrane protein required for colicin V production
VADVIGFLLIALLVMGLAGIVGSFWPRFLHQMGWAAWTGWPGRSSVFSGRAAGDAWCILVLWLLSQAHWLAEARLPRLFFGACHLSTHMSPDELAERVRTGSRCWKRSRRVDASRAGRIVICNDRRRYGNLIK